MSPKQSGCEVDPWALELGIALVLGGASLGVHRTDAVPDRGRVGLSLVTAEPLEAVLLRLADHGIEPARGIQDESFGRSIILEDPDGTPVQVNDEGFMTEYEEWSEEIGAALALRSLSAETAGFRQFRTSLIAVFLGASAAYAFSRFKFIGRQFGQVVEGLHTASVTSLHHGHPVRHQAVGAVTGQKTDILVDTDQFFHDHRIFMQSCFLII